VALRLPLHAFKENFVMKNFKSFGFVLAAILLIGCAPKGTQKKGRVSARGGSAVQGLSQAPQGSTQATNNNGVAVYWSEITRGQMHQQMFQNEVQKFLSNIEEPDGTPLSLGMVSGDSGQTTGIRFWGSVGLSGGRLILNGQNNQQVVAQGSALRIGIFDSYVGQTNSEGEVITEVPVYIAPGVEGFVGVTGMVQGNRAQITYRDNYGTITLDGQFDSNTFRGSVAYNNVSPQASGYLGVFTVRTCEFFKCQ
jgi:hypothetical protein